jgi:hypothetical protein
MRYEKSFEEYIEEVKDSNFNSRDFIDRIELQYGISPSTTCTILRELTKELKG